MRLQMLLTEEDIVPLRKMGASAKQHLIEKTAKFKEEGVAKMMLATMKNDQVAITKYNERVVELDYLRMFLTPNNIVRAAIALGFKEMSKLSDDKVIELTRKYGVSRGRPDGG